MSDQNQLRIAFAGTDGHALAFAEQINHQDVSNGRMRVVAGIPLPSDENSEENRKKLTALGVDCGMSMEALSSDIDGVMIMSVGGDEHLDLTKRFLELGKPLFVEKPLEASLARAQQLVDLCTKHECPVFSASAARFTNEIEAFLGGERNGQVYSAMAYSPYVERLPGTRGWFYYGIHAVEPLLALMGDDCVEVRCVMSEEHGPVAIGTWGDGRTGIAKATTTGAKDYGFVVWTEDGVQHATLDKQTVYHGLYRELASFFKTGTSCLTTDETLKVMSFCEAADTSMHNGGQPMSLRN